MKTRTAAAAAVVLIGLTGCSSTTTGGLPSITAPRTQTAYEACQKNGTIEYVTLADQGESLIIDTGSQYGTLTGAACVVKALNTPTYVISQIDATTALMGAQTATANGITYRWSYHPDTGVKMTITEE